MAFVRPPSTARKQSQRGWPIWLGFADENSGPSLDLLARTLRVFTLGWPALAIARLVLLLILGTNILSALASSLLVSFALLACISLDAAISALALIRPGRLPPNQHLRILLPLMAMSGLACAIISAAFAGDRTAAATIVLASCVIVSTLSGSRRGLGLMNLCGAFAGLLVAGADTLLVITVAIMALATGIFMSVGAWIRAAHLGIPERTDLSGDQARALLMEFEASSRGWFWETDRAGNISYVSEALANQLGRKAEELAGTPFAALIGASGTSDEMDGQRSLGFHFSARTAFSDIPVPAQGSNDERWWSISGQPIISPFGQFLGFRGSGSDLTEKKRSEAEIVRLARFDSLTGLANRVQMMATLEQAINPQRGIAGNCALLILDLDRFKEVNDTMGHPAGDALLRQVAQRLVRIMGTEGKVGRLGGDEFQIVLPSVTDRAALAKLGERIIHNLSQPYVIEGSQVVIGVSIGIAIAPEDGNATEKLIRNADLALYAAKGDGRGAYRFYAASMHADAEDRRQLEHDLRAAIMAGALHLEYQPVISASTERISGFEALIRWHHPTRGPISPAVFIPIAEDAGLIVTIGEWVLRTACAEAVKWPDGTRIAVNVSPIQFASANLPAFVMSALAAAGLSASRLELEITESVFLADEANTDGMFAALKAIGVRLALDDFGTGYSALGYLKTAPFDKIKIDQSFVRGAAIKGSRNAAIVKSIVGLAEALGMETTAEGAETLDELELIRSLGCSHVQGYIYGRPTIAADALTLLEENGGYAKPKGHKASREPRIALLRTVSLRHGNNVYPCRIRNISQGGAMIEGLTDVPVGTEFRIELTRDYVVRGSCRWAAEDRMGIEFAERIDLDKVRAPVEREPIALSDIPDFYREKQSGAA